MYHVSAQGIDERMINVHYYKEIMIFLDGNRKVWRSDYPQTLLHTLLPLKITSVSDYPQTPLHTLLPYTCMDELMFQLRNKMEAQSEKCLPSWNFCAVFRCRSSTVSTVSAHSRTSLRPNKWVDWHRASKARCTQTVKWGHSLVVSTQNLGDILIPFTCWFGEV